MSPGVNKALILGRLGKDPDARYLPGGQAVTKFSIATDDAWTDKNTGEKQKKTEWHNIVVFGPTAEWCGEKLYKGALIFVEGKIQTRSYEKDGQKRYVTEIVAHKVELLSPPPAEDAPSELDVNEPAPDDFPI